MNGDSKSTFSDLYLQTAPINQPYPIMAPDNGYVIWKDSFPQNVYFSPRKIATNVGYFSVSSPQDEKELIAISKAFSDQPVIKRTSLAEYLKNNAEDLRFAH